MKNTTKRLLINHSKVTRGIFGNKVLVKELSRLYKKWGLNGDVPEPFFIANAKSVEQIFEIRAERFEIVKKFRKKLEEQKREIEFYQDIINLTYKLNFGKEWEHSLELMLCSNFFEYPCYNLAINTNKHDIEYRENKGRVVLTLNPDTSIDDIKAAFPKIKRLQKSLWPSFKKENFSSKIWFRSNVLVNDFIERQNQHEIFYDFAMDEEVKIKKKDSDIASKISSLSNGDKRGKKGKKAIDNLRQIRHRGKE